MISVLSAVAEIERENILVQTMEGRRQKAREGKWNGGFAPYGYKLVDGQLQIAEEEAEVIRIIYDKYIHTTMGTARIANWLNEHGYSKVCRHNNKRKPSRVPSSSACLTIQCTAASWRTGAGTTKKIPGTRNQYHIVKQKDYALYDGIHEPIISEEDWQLAQKQRQQTNKRQLKTHSLDHEHVLSGLLKCPICGGGMCGNVNRKKKGDGTYYRDYFYYACKHRLHVDGKRCDYHHQWGEEIIDGAVEEIIHKLVNTPAFEQSIRGEDRRQAGHRRARHGDGDPCASSSVSSRAPRTDWASRSTRSISTTRITPARRRTCRSGRTGSTTRSPPSRAASPRCRPAWTTSASAGFPPTTSIGSCSTSTSCTTSSPIWRKKTFMNSFIERVEIYPERRSDGRIVKRIEFRFPVYFKGSEISGLCWDETDMSETVMVLSKFFQYRTDRTTINQAKTILRKSRRRSTREQHRLFLYSHSFYRRMAFVLRSRISASRQAIASMDSGSVRSIGCATGGSSTACASAHEEKTVPPVRAHISINSAPPSGLSSRSYSLDRRVCVFDSSTAESVCGSRP